MYGLYEVLVDASAANTSLMRTRLPNPIDLISEETQAEAQQEKEGANDKQQL